MRVYLTLQDRVFTSHCAPRQTDSKVIVTHHAPGHIPSPLLGAIGAAPIMGIGRSREISGSLLGWGNPGLFFGACMRKFVTSDPASAAASGSRCSAAGFIITPSYISDRISDRMPAATAASSKMHVEAGAGVDAKFKLDAKVSTPAIARLASPSSPCDSRAAATLRAADDASPLRPAASPLACAAAP